MKTYINPDKIAWNKIITRPVMDYHSLHKKVRSVLEDVRANGDEALKKYTLEFDGVVSDGLQVSEKEMADASALVPANLKKAIEIATANIKTFHEKQMQSPEIIETMPGVQCWRRSVGIEKVGLYIPGGTAPLFSTVLMLAIPARLAGCKELILCTPPAKDNTIHPAIIYAAQIAGIKTIFKAGGVQAIAAMAYGTETIPGVYKIFGPGNQYVSCAKQLIQMDGIAIDMPAGPSEVCVIADETAIPSFIAADLLSQAEHGTDSQVLLVCATERIVRDVTKEIEEQLNNLPRKNIARQALENSNAVVLDGMESMLELVNDYAPEHLIIACNNAELIAERIINAGSVFIGNYSPESAGDYASGTNHTLPTNGYAKSFSGVSIDSFVKKITYQRITKTGLQNIGATVEVMAAAEGLEAHKNAISIRLNNES
jgi:histidinol dehydrogenase